VYLPVPAHLDGGPRPAAQWGTWWVNRPACVAAAVVAGSDGAPAAVVYSSCRTRSDPDPVRQKRDDL